MRAASRLARRASWTSRFIRVLPQVSRARRILASWDCRNMAWLGDTGFPWPRAVEVMASRPTAMWTRDCIFERGWGGKARRQEK